MELGVAGTIGVNQISGDKFVGPLINKWLEAHPDVEVIDIKFSTNATNEEWGSDVLIIYRREV